MANIKAPCGGIILGEGLIVEDGVIKVEGGGGGGVDYQPQITALENSKYDDVVLTGQKMDFKAKGTTKKSITLPTQDIAQMNTNKNEIERLDNSKYDDVAIAGQKLSFKAKGVEKKSVTLPTQDISQMTTNKNDIATLKGQVADLISRVEALETP